MITSNKRQLLLRDIVSVTDKHNLTTRDIEMADRITRKNRVIMRKKSTGEIINDTTNIVTINGSMFGAEKWFGYIPPAQSLVYYDLDLNLDIKGTNPEGEITKDERVWLYCMADTGCDKSATARKATVYNSRIEPVDLLPFRCVPNGTTVDSKYAGKKTDGLLDKYYFKEFDSAPTFRRVSDNTILHTLYEPTTKPIDSYIEVLMSVSLHDFKEHFDLIGKPDECAVSSMHLCTALKTQGLNGPEYTRIRPVTLVHFTRETLVEDNKEIDITYQSFF